MISFLIVGIGGAIGAMARYGLSLAMPKFDVSTAWPFATLAANFVGSLLIGLLVATFFVSGKLGEGWRLLLVVGVLGGFTTFSAFSLELVQLIQVGRTGVAASYWLASTIAVPVACYIGWMLGR